MSSDAVHVLAVLGFEELKGWTKPTSFKGKDMNLRKTFLALGAMILGVGFFGASPANAYVGTPQVQGTPGGAQVTCYLEELAFDINHWPGNHYWYCGANEGANGGAPKGYLSSMPGLKTGTSGRTLLFSNQVRFFVFANNTAYQTFCTGSVISPAGATRLIPTASCIAPVNFPSTTRGISVIGGSFPYSVVVENSVDGGPGMNPVNEWSPVYLKHNLLHEAGHHLDYYLRTLVTTPGTIKRVNTSTEFAAMLAKDWAAINAYDSGNPVNTRNGCNNTTGSGMFITKRDKNNQFICNNSGAGPLVNISATAGYTIGMNNQQVLQAAWPYIYKPDSTNVQGANAELAASIFAAYSGGSLIGPGIGANPGNQDQGAYLGQFACLLRLQGQLQLNGTVSLCP